MKTLRLIGFLIALFSAHIAAAKSSKPTIQDLVFTSDHLIANLGPKTLILSEHADPEFRSQDFKLLQELGLDKKSQFFAFPADGILPQVLENESAVYPRSLDEDRVGGEAEFLVLVGNNGKVVSLFCFRRTYNAFGLSGAMAILKWRYEPAKLGPDKVPVPILLRVKFSYKAPWHGR